MSRAPKEFQAFTSLVDKILTVSKAGLDARVRAEKERAVLNPRKRGPKPKVK
jgi:hypothetical protein